MIHLPNGHSFRFCVAAGALGYDGNGYWFEKPWLWSGLINPDAFVIITKTLTYRRREGNYRWYAPWRCFRFIKSGILNAFGLTNNGYRWWIEDVYPKIPSQRRMVVSIAPENMQELQEMIEDLNQCNLVGVELNVSCPNVNNHQQSIDFVCSLAERAVLTSKHPIFLKLGVQLPYKEICKQLDGKITAFDAINAVPWNKLYKAESPLAQYGYDGAVSHAAIKQLARDVTVELKSMNLKTSVISGGGVDSFFEAIMRLVVLRADALSFGTIFIKKPWLPNQIVNLFNKCST